MPSISLHGRRLHYERAGRGRPRVVFVHGGLVDSRVWDSQFGWFAERTDAIRFDLPGDGHSGSPGESFSGVDCLRCLMSQLGLDTAALIGLSGGARIAIDFAISEPAKTEKLIAVAPGLSGYESWTLPKDLVSRAQAAIRSGDRHLAVTTWLDLWAPATKDSLIEAALDNAEALFTGPELLDLDPPAIGRLSELRAPTLVVVGDRDLSDIGSIARLIVNRAENAKLHFIGGADHFPNVYAPRRFNDVVARFIGLRR